MNKAKIKQDVQRAIDKMPTSIELYRFEKISDGAGGYTLSTEPTLIGTFNAILDNSNNSFISPQAGDGGTVVSKRSYKLIAVYDPNIDLQRHDFFTVNGLTYKINNPVNILNLDIYWEVDLEVQLNG